MNNTEAWARVIAGLTLACTTFGTCNDCGATHSEQEDCDLLTGFVPCSRKHKSCSKFHASMVREYRAEREREETALEGETGNYPGDIEHRKAKGGTMIDFRTWLVAHKGAAS